MRSAVLFSGGLALLGSLMPAAGLTEVGHLGAFILTRILLFLVLGIIFWLSFEDRASPWLTRVVCAGVASGALAWILPQAIAIGESAAEGPGVLMSALTLLVMLPMRFWYMIAAATSVAAALIAELFVGPMTGVDIEFVMVMLLITLISARTVMQAKLTSRFRFFARQELDGAFHALRLKELEVQQQASHLNAFILAMDQGVSVLDRDQKFVAWNPQYERMFDLPQGFMKAGLPFESIVRHLRSIGFFGQREMDERRQNAIDKPRPGDAFELPLPGGRYLDVRRSGLPDGGVVTTYTDITERKRAENLTRLLGMQDPLTQLANRALFLENLVAAIGESARHNFQVGLMMIDLDHFKPVNDTHGHPVGDAVLKKVAEILSAAVRDLDTVARLGGDEFAVILTNLSWPEQADLPARRILAALQAPMDIDGLRIQIGGSIGLAYYPDHGRSPDALISRADEALYAAKAAGRNCIRHAATAASTP